VVVPTGGKKPIIFHLEFRYVALSDARTEETEERERVAETLQEVVSPAWVVDKELPTSRRKMNKHTNPSIIPRL
jgi:RNA binding exosome subunit